MIIPLSRARLPILATALFSACTQGDPPPPLFGGQGAVVEAPLPPASAAEASALAGPCGAPSAPGDVALLDDFEDGDSKIFKAFQREGWWFAVDDDSAGAMQSPSGEFAPERLAAAEASPDNLFAAHFTASGQTQWGAVWGVAPRWVDKGVRCPFNASGFAGMRLRARGKGTIRVSFGMPETLAKDGGGTCTEGCYDSHGKTLFLSDAWQEFVLPWDKLQQQGWGVDVRFDPSRLIQVGFQVSPKEVPADFWIDDLAFLPKPASAPSAASTTGAR